MAKKQTWQCEKQAKRKEAREYLRDKKGPSKFCGNTHSTQAPKESVLDMPVGVMLVNQQPTAESKEIVKRIYDEVPSAQIHQAEGEVALPHLNHSGSTDQRGSSSSEESSTNVEMENSFAEATTSSGSPPKPLSSEETEQSRKDCPATTITRSGQHPVGGARGPPTCNDHR